MILAAASLTISTHAQAGLFDTVPAEGGFIISGFGGLAIPFDSNFSGELVASGAGADVDLDFDNSAFYGGSIGVRLPFKFLTYIQPRVELEYARYEADVAGGSFNGGDQIFSGGQSVNYFFLNNVSDIQWGEDQRLIPYFGGGIGAADTSTNIAYFPNNGVATSPTIELVNSGTAFATQSILGLSFKASENIDVFGEGRYIKSYGLDVQRRAVSDFSLTSVIDDDPDGITFTGGVRYNF